MKRFFLFLTLALAAVGHAADSCSPVQLAWADQLGKLRSGSCNLKQRDGAGLNLYDIAGLNGNGEMQKYLASKGVGQYSPALQRLVSTGLRYLGHGGADAVKSYQRANGFPVNGKLSYGWLSRFYRDLTRKVQSDLAGRGYKVGSADGLMGNSTVEALQDFRRQNKLAAVSYRHLDEPLLARLAQTRGTKAGDKADKKNDKAPAKVEKNAKDKASASRESKGKNDKNVKTAKVEKNSKNERLSALRVKPDNKVLKKDSKLAKAVREKEAKAGRKGREEPKAKPLLSNSKRLKNVRERAQAQRQVVERRRLERRPAPLRRPVRTVEDENFNFSDGRGDHISYRTGSFGGGSYGNANGAGSGYNSNASNPPARNGNGDAGYGLGSLSASVSPAPGASTPARSSAKTNEALAQQRASLGRKARKGSGFTKVVGRLGATSSGGQITRCTIGGQRIETGWCNSHYQQSRNKLCQAVMDSSGNVFSITCGKK